MSGYMHHVPGRLRFKLLQLKGQVRRAEEVEKAVRQMKGVRSIEANTVTGSLLIHYDVTEVESYVFLDGMKKTLLQFGAMNSSCSQLNASSCFTGGGVVADKLVSALLDKLIERSAVAIVGALL
jgi:hypothetical protein